LFESKEEKMNLYIGNLSFETTERDLQQAFEAYGAVSSASVITDRETGRSRGFGFVEMPTESEARAAIDGLNDKDLNGRDLKVNEAKPRGSGGGGGGGSYDRGRSY
jgi:RNA recognition motif-containing protein